ncbi:hypothetical protein Taro_052011 [Colocasia esculenta]|uniref:Uncharacterized protein n=1 Tax=Colocasia esculenta TaxID=4460 RepID=A0A843XIH7_COLES|nr:hypothetical protein [Colocasia esculenta]
MKAKHFLNGLRPAYITQLAPLDIQTYTEMVKKAQLLEDATDLTDRIKGESDGDYHTHEEGNEEEQE